MNNTIYPCLWSDGKAKESAEFYCSVFKNSRILVENPVVVKYELAGLKVMGLNGGPQFSINPSISLFVLCETIEDTDRTWNKLIEGGKVLIPIDKYPWSERYGWLQDKYGMTWQISVVYKEGDPFKITPSLLFTDKQFGRAAEAIKLYTSVFKNSASTVFYPYPEGDANAGKTMYAEFKIDGYDLIAMDGPGEHAYTFNEAVSLVVDCNSQEEIDHYWDALTADGGQESMCGWLKDKFGVSWQIVPAILGELMSDPVKAPKVMQVVLQSRKFDIASLMNA